ncbi:alpha-L-fucosidase [candidate division KSB1 bacterium]|nr:alpha-L-fucosidase [candidate division KSB1 bacterium]
MMKQKRQFPSIILIFILLVSIQVAASDIENLQRAFTDLRFGMFIHFGIRTFTGGSWGEANQDVTAFNPTNLDCGQWADAAVSANMTFGILTTKHHDGFCLWDSETTENDVASSPWKEGQGDVVQEYVDAFRSRGLEPCLYYSIWDNTKGIGNGDITESDMEFIIDQMTEILSNYGPIKMLFIDGWSWKMGHRKVPYDEIRELVKELQPECLLVDNTHIPCLFNNDLIHYEAGGSCPPDNTLPAMLSKLIYTTGGNSWFWDGNIPTANLMSVNSIVSSNLNYLEPRWCTFLLNCPPNSNGLLDENIVNRLVEVGENWSPDLSRPALPAQEPQIENVILPVSASATSGNAFHAIDAVNDRFYYSVWESSANLPQSITLNLGLEIPDVSILYYVPKYIPMVNPQEEGSIQSYKIYASGDNIDFSEIAKGEWSGDTKMKVAIWTPINARYIRLEILTAVDDFAAVTELAIGRGEVSSEVKTGFNQPHGFTCIRIIPIRSIQIQ